MWRATRFIVTTDEQDLCFTYPPRKKCHQLHHQAHFLQHICVQAHLLLTLPLSTDQTQHCVASEIWWGHCARPVQDNNIKNTKKGKQALKNYLSIPDRCHLLLTIIAVKSLEENKKTSGLKTSMTAWLWHWKNSPVCRKKVVMPHLSHRSCLLDSKLI